ncbi:MAG TPA: metallophosphoesterase [Blastocatellia bacterium]|nr:metallophosphoesterase [Blastocatellia bacterium]
MRIFAIGDMHLAGGTGKTMDRFGERWRDHDRRIFDAWERVGRDDDLLLIVGDTTWAMRFDEAKPDLDRIGRMKGTKILLKGNHDYWWQSVSKMSRALDPTIKILQASSIIMNRVAIAGTRGWTCPNDAYFEEQDAKIYEREVGRLQLALESLRGRKAEYDRLIVALHYPPVNDRHEPSGFTELIDQYQADACVYGHLHGEAIQSALTGMRGKTRYYLVSADAVDFAPARIQLDNEAANHSESQI